MVTVPANSVKILQPCTVRAGSHRNLVWCEAPLPATLPASDRNTLKASAQH